MKLKPRFQFDPPQQKKVLLDSVPAVFKLMYECDCGKRVNEMAKQCPYCKRVNMDWAENHFKRTSKIRD